MNFQDLRNLLEKSDDKLSILSDPNLLLTNYNVTIVNVFELIRDFLNDSEKLALFKYPYFQNLGSVESALIFKFISDENIKFRLLKDENIMSRFSSKEILDMIQNLSDESKAKIATNTYLTLEILHLKDYEITELVKNISSEKVKLDILEEIILQPYLKAKIIVTLSPKERIRMLLKEPLLLPNNQIDIISSLDVNDLGDFLVNHKSFCVENDIHPYEITMNLSPESQKDFVSILHDLDLPFNEKKEILATLKPDVKKSIDISNFPENLQIALQLETRDFDGKIILDLNRNLEDYRGLDNLLSVNPIEFTEKQKARFLQLCDICPDLQVINILNNVSYFASSTSEYKEAEEWISSLINSLDPTYSQLQKLAVIDNAIGKKISYTPDKDTEVFNPSDCRALWKIIVSGYGICNGIAPLEQYILSKVGIESEIVSSKKHAFLKIKNIELPIENGEFIKGSTILDPTWNLTDHRFGAKPYNFCISYEQARKNDIDINGNDHNSHKNDDSLKDVTLGLDEKNLRALFASVGLADKDGIFPVIKLLESSKSINEANINNPEENIRQQFSLLAETCPEFATCQNSTISILSENLLNSSYLKFNKCVVNRVYDKDDDLKKPIVYVYIDLGKIGKKFYIADKSQGKMVEYSQKDFEQQFEIYKSDLQLLGGNKPWESSKEVIENLSKSSGKIIVEGEKER